MIGRIGELLQGTIGLNPESIGLKAIERAVQTRMGQLGLQTTDEYWTRLHQGTAEFHALVELVVVPETCFFRDKEPFQALTRLVQWSAAHSADRKQWRVLSVPCSTGEEPYSIAITLLKAGLSPSQFHIDAVDISTRALALARAGFYRQNAFRGTNIFSEEQFFQPQNDGWELRPNIRSLVCFQQGNLLDASFLPGEAPYDFIFCRNLLIYFGPEKQQQAIGILHRWLQPQGVVFVGHAEVPIWFGMGFEPSQFPQAFACQHKSPAVLSAGETTVSTSKTHRAQASPAPLARKPAPASQLLNKALPGRVLEKPVAVPLTKPTSSLLEDAKRLADAGSLQAAEALCVAYLRNQGPSEQAFYLLGLVRDAAGKTAEAAECYRKALYLQPNHYESLMHLAMCAEQQGMREEAKVLHQRAERVFKSRPATGKHGS